MVLAIDMAKACNCKINYRKKSKVFDSEFAKKQKKYYNQRIDRNALIVGFRLVYEAKVNKSE